MTQFSQQIKQILHEENLTITAAAALVGMDRGNFSRIINGKEGITLERAERIANALGATLCVNVKKTGKIAAA